MIGILKNALQVAAELVNFTSVFAVTSRLWG